MSDSTEHSILSNIPDFADEGGTNDTSSGGQPNTQTQQTEGGQPNTSAQPTQTNQQGSGTDNTLHATPAQHVEFRRRQDGLLERTNPDNPKVRDLVDPITGRIVAQGGIERRVYEEGQRHARENTQLTQRVAQLTGFVQSVNQVTQEAARLNISPDNQIVALKVMADFMKDPVRTLQYLVEEVKGKGYPIPFLTEGVSPGMDLAAVARMIDAKMQPLTQQQNQGRQQAQARQAAETELNSFLNENPDSEQNLDVLTGMLQAQPTLTIQTAYTKMIRWAHEQGLDWTQPLSPQIAARQQQQTNQPQQTSNQRPLPGSRNVRNGAQPVNGANGSGAQFNENASWADIIKSSMQEHNVNIN